MTFEAFEAAAHEAFDAVPADFRSGVDGLEVTRRTVTHPTLPEIYTLGECLSEFYPSEFGGPGEVRSRVVLYYGSFLELSRTRDDWQWEDEIWETITHEIRHHLEHLASEDELEEMDYAEDQNFARREGEPFDPFFFRSGKAFGEGVYEVDGDLFVEREISARDAGEWIPVELQGRPGRARIPENLGADITYLHLPEDERVGDRERFVVLIRRRGALAVVRGLLGGRPAEVAEVEGVWEPNEENGAR